MTVMGEFDTANRNSSNILHVHVNSGKRKAKRQVSVGKN